MIGIRRLAGAVFAVIIVAVSMLLAVPAGSAAGPRSVPLPPPDGERSAGARQSAGPLPIVGPATVSAAASADGSATILDQELVTCAVAHGAIGSSGRVDLAGTAAGDAAVSVDGAGPVGFVRLGGRLALSGAAGLARPAPPGGDQAGRGCGADDAPGSAHPIVMSPEQVAAVPSDVSAAVQGAAPSAGSGSAQGPGRPTAEEASADIGPVAPGDAGDGAVPGKPPSAVPGAAGKSTAEPVSPALGPAPWGVVIAVLGAVAVALVVPTAVSFALHNRRGQKWVRANVRTVAKVAPAAGIRMTPEMDWPGLPTFGVQLALRADGGTQSVTEVEQ